jgi:DNA primase large subunit
VVSYTTTQRKALRRLANLAYERELGAELANLEARFAEWRAQRISAFQISDLIHEFHDGPSRELYKLYGSIDTAYLVARAIAQGLLHEDEAPTEILAKLADLIASYRSAQAASSR